MTPEQFGQYMRDDIAKWTKVAKERNIELTTEDRLTWPTTPQSPPTPTRRRSRRHPRRVRRRASVRRSFRRASSTRRIARSKLAGLRDRRGAPSDASDAALAAVQELEPAPQATVLGRSERVDMASAALVNGITSHTFDFDDTHLKTIIHPAGPVASAVLALAEHIGIERARASIDALVLGIDVACRIGNMMYPDHYDRGWHITGLRPACSARPPAARACSALDVEQHDDGARHRRVAAGRRARAVRLDDQAVPSRRRGARRV